MHSPRIRLIEEVLSATGGELTRYAERASAITEEIFGNRRTLFNPIYISNVCANDCSYCGFRRSNRKFARRTLTPAEAAVEARALGARGVKNILILAGEYAIKPYFEMLLGSIRAIKQTAIARWLGVEVAPLDEQRYASLRSEGITCVTVYQETYDQRRYCSLHSSGDPKYDFAYRHNALSRASRAGIPEVGLGVLYGIGDCFSDTLAMAQHAQGLMDENSALKLRFAFPRLMSSDFQSEHARSETLSEQVLFKVMVAIRLAFPQSSVVITGRESVDFLVRAASIANIMGNAGSTVVGGYSLDSDANSLRQYTLNQRHSFPYFLQRLVSSGYVTS